MKIALLLIVLLAAGCNATAQLVDTRTTEIITAQTRRTQILTELELLDRQHRRAVRIEDRAVIQSQVNRLRFELEQLNAIIDR